MFGKCTKYRLFRGFSSSIRMEWGWIRKIVLAKPPRIFYIFFVNTLLVG